MKCTILIDHTRNEEVIVHAHRENTLTAAIEALCRDEAIELIGYQDSEACRLPLQEIMCFITQKEHVIAVSQSGEFRVKKRLYELEKQLPFSFLKINQSCIANLHNIQRFDASLSGTLRVVFTNGYTDYVSRRNVKSVKERLGL